MFWLKNVIGTPKQMHGVANEAEYRQVVREFLARHGVPPTIREVGGEQPHAHVNGGWWKVYCACGNAPCAGPPGWDGDPDSPSIAICFECGLLTRPVFPKERERRAIEGALLQRPDPHTRHFFATDERAQIAGDEKAHTLGFLRTENKRLGVG